MFKRLRDRWCLFRVKHTPIRMNKGYDDAGVFYCYWDMPKFMRRYYKRKGWLLPRETVRFEAYEQGR